MGYDVWAEGEWDIAAEKGEAFSKALLKACAKKDGYNNYHDWYDAELPLPDPGNGAGAYFASRFDENVIVESFDDGSYKLSFTDDSVRNTDYDQWIFVAAAPFANEDDTIFFQGEDHHKWIWAVVDGKLSEQDGETVYGNDVAAPEVLKQIIDIIYPDGRLDTEYGGDMLGALHLIENALREGGFGPQAGMTELERLADI